jgi:hypothetical protein
MVEAAKDSEFHSYSGLHCLLVAGHQYELDSEDALPLLRAGLVRLVALPPQPLPRIRSSSLPPEERKVVSAAPEYKHEI